jgi:hypothetical protein
MPFIIAAAQPTPGFTLKAEKGQFKEQAPHSMHASLFSMTAFRPTMEKTPWGQTSVHFPQPVHFSVSSSSVATFLRYLCFILSTPVD